MLARGKATLAAAKEGAKHVVSGAAHVLEEERHRIGHRIEEKKQALKAGVAEKIEAKLKSTILDTAAMTYINSIKPSVTADPRMPFTVRQFTQRIVDIAYTKFNSRLPKILDDVLLKRSDEVAQEEEKLNLEEADRLKRASAAMQGEVLTEESIKAPPPSPPPSPPDAATDAQHKAATIIEKNVRRSVSTKRDDFTHTCEPSGIHTNTAAWPVPNPGVLPK